MLNKLIKVVINKWNRIALSVTLAMMILITASPVLACHVVLSKNGPTTAEVAEQITYTLDWSTVVNSSFNSDLSLTDYLPADVEYISADHNGVYDSNTHTVTWDLGNHTGQNGNESGSVQVVVKINNSVSVGDNIVNKATLFSDYGNKDADWTTTIIGSAIPPIITLDKTGPDTAVPGQNITYDLTWSVSDADVTNLVLTDAIPAGTTFVSASNGGTESSGTITWNLGSKNAGDTGTVTLEVTINSVLNTPDSIHNTAKLDSNETNEVEDTAVTKIKTNTYYDVQITKTADKDTVNVGEELTYTLSYEIVGNTTATDVVVADLLPAEVTLVSADTGYVTHTLPNGRTVIGWRLGDLATGTTGSLDITVTVDSMPDDSFLTNLGAIGSNCSGKSDPIVCATLIDLYNTYGGGSLPTCPSGSCTVGCDKFDFDVLETKVEVAPYFNLDIEKLAPEFANPGDDITYTINWEVTGNTVAKNVRIFDYLPEGTVVKSTDPAYDNIMTVMGTKYQVQTLVWDLGDVTPDATGTIELIATANAGLTDGETLDNMVKIMSDTKSAQDNAVTTITVNPYYDVQITKTADKDTVNVGEELTYTIDWEVTGNTDAANTVITDTLPSEVSLVSATGSYATTTNGLVWNLGTITPNATGTFEVVVNVDSLPQVGIITNEVEIVSGQKSAQDDVTTLVTIAPYFNLDIEKLAPEFANPGDDITYTINWEVTGNTAGTHMVIVDKLPAGVTFKSASDNGIFFKIQKNAIQKVGGSQKPLTPYYNYPFGYNSYVSWDLGTITPNASGTVTLIVTIDDQAKEGDEIINEVTLLSANASASASAKTTVTVQPHYDVTIIKDVDKASAYVGDDLTYTIDWEVLGNTKVNNVLITDTLPTNVSFVSADNNGVYDSTTHTIVWDLGTVIPGTLDASGTFTVVVTTDVAGTATNYVEIIGNSKTANDEATTKVTTQSTPYYDLNITKVADQNSVYVNDTLTYTIDWEVLGNMDAPNVVITDTLPAETTFVSADNSGVYDTLTNTIVWDLGTVASNTNGTFTVVVTVNSMPQSNTVTNVVDMVSDQKSVQDDVTTAVNTHGSSYFALGIVKSAESQVEPGQNITYTIDWSVSGNKLAQNVLITDTLPNNVSFVSADNNGVYDSTTHTIVWDLGDVTPNDSDSFTVIVSTTGLVSGDSVTNNVKIASMGQVVSDDATTAIYKGGGGGGSYHKVNIEKLGPASINAGEDINYTINWATRGTETAIDVIITDILPTNTTFYSATGNYTYATSTHTLTWKLGNIWPADSGSFDVVLKTNATTLNNGDILTNQVDIKSGVEKDNDSVNTTVTKGGGGSTSAPSVQLKYEYPLEKTVLGSYSEVVTVINTGDVALTNGRLLIDLPESFISFISSINSNYVVDTTAQTLSWDIPTLAVGAQDVYTFVIQATTAGSQVETTVDYMSDQASANTSGKENITEGVVPPPVVPPVEPAVVIPPVVAGDIILPPADNTVVAGSQTCETDDCASCGFWMWLTVILLHLLAMGTYWFYVSKEEIKENENNEYYIIKGSWAWLLPVFLILAIIFLLLILVCNFVPFWALLIVLVSYFLALVSHTALIRKAELKYSPILPLLLTVIALVAYLICTNWSWWVWVLILLFYVLTLVTYYIMIVKMDTKSRKYWWVVVLIMTILTVGIEILLRLCQCSEVIR